ncbi:MAG: gliding motility-associated C-terminal domain-containing protein [Chitinophagaceae bacterium]
MLKKLTILFLVLSLCFAAKADHITGGQMFYTYTGSSGGLHQYNFTLQFYMRCNSGRQFNNPTTIIVYDRGNGNMVSTLTVPLSSSETIGIQNHNRCITNPPEVCYVVGYYHFEVSVPGNINGYVVASQVNYRISGINNLLFGYGQVGATYTAEIPGNHNNSSPVNNSARFIGTDLVVICANNNFSYSFAASDADGDHLRYSFCDAYRSGSSGVSSAAPPPPYNSVPYGQEYSGSAPLGSSVQINQQTGLITGIAPMEGVYVVTVCVEEIRNGQVIATQRKDLQIHIAPCQIAAASLPPELMLCRDTKTITFQNLSNSPLIKTYNWQVTTATGELMFSSDAPAPTYTFPDTGKYNVKLLINHGEECSDSISSKAFVYPGLITAYSAGGVCFNKPTQFTDASTTIYGSINSWNWNFGEALTTSDFSNSKNPSYTFLSMGDKQIELAVGTTKGCKDTVYKTIKIFDKPPLSLKFKDSLICVNDKVQLLAEGNGVFHWSPSTNLTQASTSSPFASPATTTTYTVELNDNGCINQDSVRISVTDHVNLQVMPDTTICQGDAITLRIKSDGFQYNWSPSSQIDVETSAQPVAVTHETTTYQVTANIGSCTATKQIKVNTVPYPVVVAGMDTTICFGSKAQLHSITDGNSVLWTPAAGLSSTRTLQPVATPGTSTKYIVSAFNTRGCPKAGRDSVTVFVLPKIYPFAGRDTNVVYGQPLQLNAAGGISYLWTPSTGLSSTNTADPVALYTESTEKVKYTVYVFNEAGCADSAFITVHMYKTAPSVFVPTAFTPNNDGLNDRLRPTVAGMQKIDYFMIYNRWGKQVFNGDFNKGWDGKFNGVPQETGVFLWIVRATDFAGKPYFQKGTITLIR